ncbi:MAG: DUF488 domain-containing protein [Acidobacteriota bacterium]|jgi:uncharacterized protein (DUF488 family)
MGDPSSARRIYTVGHSNRTPEELLEVLAPAGIRTLVDVRRYPSSRRHPHFNRGEFRGFLLRHGIIYHHLGQQLGGMLDGSYETYMATEPFRQGLQLLEELADSSTTTVLCAEREPRDCHRAHIADALRDRGWRVTHLLDPGEHREHRPSGPQRRLF